MEITVTIGTAGTDMVIHAASLLYDLWEDYNVYRREAGSINRNEEPLRYKRVVRAAVHSFFGYFEGVLNVWVLKLDPAVDLEETSFGAKIGIVRRAMPPGRRVPRLDVERARTIRNTIVHVKPTDSDTQTMEALLDGQFFRDADGFVRWLRQASKILNMECHPDVPAIVEEFTSDLR